MVWVKENFYIMFNNHLGRILGNAPFRPCELFLTHIWSKQTANYQREETYIPEIYME